VYANSTSVICAAPNFGEGIKGGLVGVRQGVKVALSRPKAAVPKSLPHNLEVSTAGEQP
jgi:hypothetical protein